MWSVFVNATLCIHAPSSSRSPSSVLDRDLKYRVSVGIMRQYKFCPDKQKYNNAKPFPVYVVATEEIENYYEYSKYGA